MPGPGSSCSHMAFHISFVTTGPSQQHKQTTAAGCQEWYQASPVADHPQCTRQGEDKPYQRCIVAADLHLLLPCQCQEPCCGCAIWQNDRQDERWVGTSKSALYSLVQLRVTHNPPRMVQPLLVCPSQSASALSTNVLRASTQSCCSMPAVDATTTTHCRQHGGTQRQQQQQHERRHRSHHCQHTVSVANAYVMICRSV